MRQKTLPQPHPRRLRAAHAGTRNGLSSMLRLARPTAFQAHTMVRVCADRPSSIVTLLYPSAVR